MVDRSPELTVNLEDDAGQPLDRVVGNGNEYVRLLVTDVDDLHRSSVISQSLGRGVIASYSRSIFLLVRTRFCYTSSNCRFQLESGTLLLVANGVGMHGGSASIETSVPFLLTPPELIFMEACDALGVVNNMTFGQTAMLKLGIASDRPIENMRAQLTQQGWRLLTPRSLHRWMGEPFDGHPCNTTGLERPDVTWWLFRPVPTIPWWTEKKSRGFHF